MTFLADGKTIHNEAERVRVAGTGRMRLAKLDEANDVTGNSGLDEEEQEGIAKLYSFLKDACQLEISKAKHYSSLMYFSYENLLKI